MSTNLREKILKILIKKGLYISKDLELLIEYYIFISNCFASSSGKGLPHINPWI